MKNSSISKMLNEMIYKFSLNIISIFINDVFTFYTNMKCILPLSALQVKVINTINFIKINIKYHYNQKYQSLIMCVSEYVLLQLHYSYFISVITNRKLN